MTRVALDPNRDAYTMAKALESIFGDLSLRLFPLFQFSLEGGQKAFWESSSPIPPPTWRHAEACLSDPPTPQRIASPIQSLRGSFARISNFSNSNPSGKGRVDDKGVKRVGRYVAVARQFFPLSLVPMDHRGMMPAMVSSFVGVRHVDSHDLSRCSDSLRSRAVIAPALMTQDELRHMCRPLRY